MNNTSLPEFVRTCCNTLGHIHSLSHALSNCQSPKLIHIIARHGRSYLSKHQPALPITHVYTPHIRINMSSHVERCRWSSFHEQRCSASFGSPPPPIRKTHEATFFTRSTGRLAPWQGGRHDLFGRSDFFGTDARNLSRLVDAWTRLDGIDSIYIMPAPPSFPFSWFLGDSWRWSIVQICASDTSGARAVHTWRDSRMSLNAILRTDRIICPKDDAGIHCRIFSLNFLQKITLHAQRRILNILHINNIAPSTRLITTDWDIKSDFSELRDIDVGVWDLHNVFFPSHQLRELEVYGGIVPCDCSRARARPYLSWSLISCDVNHRVIIYSVNDASPSSLRLAVRSTPGCLSPMHNNARHCKGRMLNES